MRRSRASAWLPDRRGPRRRARDRGGAWRRQADDALPGRARRRKPLRERPARHVAGGCGCGAESVRRHASTTNWWPASIAPERRPWASRGIDAFLVEAEQMDPALGAVGRVTRSNPALLHLLTGKRLSAGGGVRGGRPRRGNVYNVNADQMAVACAAAFRRAATHLPDRRGGRAGWRETGSRGC